MWKSADRKEKQWLSAVRAPVENFKVDVRSEEKTREECKGNLDGMQKNL
jgi:hypothetical protein